MIDRLSYAITALILAGVFAFGGPFEPVKIWEMAIGGILTAMILAAICREFASNALIARPMSPNRTVIVTLAGLLAIVGLIYQNSGSVRPATAHPELSNAEPIRHIAAPVAAVVPAEPKLPEPSDSTDSPASAAGSPADAMKTAAAVMVSRHGSRHRKARRLHQRRS